LGQKMLWFEIILVFKSCHCPTIIPFFHVSSMYRVVSHPINSLVRYGLKLYPPMFFFQTKTDQSCGFIGAGVDKYMCVCVIIYASIHNL
jgi:hypothetical protein